MRIKSLEIIGFKSFADPGRLHFGEGITGVVGPNGCGKSNIIDAIRWVMGEMSAKHLRGRAMQDVIFAGSESRGPSGMAEVTITFHNDGDAPPTYAAYPEIAITRRLHRDGTSEYLINKVQSRLRDITDLFLGTGVGTRAYSIIEQGRIGFIVSARPEDRRTLIEEVAGISKFKVRRKAAERRMLATEQNLARVNDVIAELERQLASLQRQAKKAERYRRLKDELRDVDLHVASMRLLELTVLEKQQNGARAELETRYEDTLGAVAADEARLEAERHRLMHEEERLQIEQRASAEIEARLSGLERDLAHWRAQLQETERRRIEAQADLGQSGERRGQMTDEQARIASEIASTEDTVSMDRERLQIASSGVEDVQRSIAGIDLELERLRTQGLEIVHELARQRSLHSSLEREHGERRERSERASADRAVVCEQEEVAAAREVELHTRRAHVERELAAFRTRREELGATLKQLLAQSSASEERILGLRSALAEARSRLESLEAIARRLEGFAAGVRTLMNPGGDGGPAVSGISGLVADVLRVPSQYERAIEAALGEQLQCLVAESPEAGVAGIDYLKTHDGGRSGFVPRQPKAFAAGRAPEAHPGLLAAARDVVEVSPGHEAIAEALLRDVMIVQDLPAALSIWQRNGHQKTLVTLDGDLLEPSGALAGGSHSGAGLLARAREIRELRETVTRLEAELREASAAHRHLEAQRLQAEVDVQQLDKDLRQSEIESVELGKDLQAAAAERGRLGERAEVLAHEIAEHEDALRRVTSETHAASAAAAQAQAQDAELQARMLVLGGQRSERAADLEERVELLTELKVLLAARDEKLVSGRTAMQRLREAESEIALRIERAEKALREGELLTADLEQRISEGAQQGDAIAKEALERRGSLAEARAAYEAERDRLAQVEQGLRESRRHGELVRESLVQLKMDLQRLDLERAQLIERIAERHDSDLRRVVGDYHLRPLPGPEDLQRRAELEKSLKSMGSINLTAIEECAEVEKRYAFLTAQRDDLTAALDSLKRAIQRINRTSRERFQEAFDAVNNMFQQVFPRLFRGGEARLTLLDHDDVLEAGVDIVAQPPGKKLQSVGLLSGGEKALTATALIFSIFLIKPSPFCVLDEVDAPLDDANVGRFNEMLREISSLAQFIVITHNKLTMTEADRLYGITMEEPGMSKLVSVDLGSSDASRAA